MKFWNSIFRNTRTLNSEETRKFRSDVRKSIDIIGGSPEDLENGKIVSLLTQNGIKKSNALEIITLLPIAFVRRMLQNVNWPKTYIEKVSSKNTRKLYKNNDLFIITERETDIYFNENPKSEILINICGRSAEFKAINELLLKNDNADISEIKLTETVIIRSS